MCSAISLRMTDTDRNCDVQLTALPAQAKLKDSIDRSST